MFALVGRLDFGWLLDGLLRIASASVGIGAMPAV